MVEGAVVGGMTDHHQLRKIKAAKAFGEALARAVHETAEDPAWAERLFDYLLTGERIPEYLAEKLLALAVKHADLDNALVEFSEATEQAHMSQARA